MYWLLISLRLAHIVFGALWFGMMAFTVLFLTPAMRDAGPAGQPVMAALQRRRMMTIVPLFALATIVSGLVLMHRTYPDMSSLLASRMGFALFLGAVASLIAFALGLAVMRPAMMRAAKLAQSLASAGTDHERAELGARIQRLRARGSVMGLIIFGLLLFAVGAMAVARYL